MATLKGSCLCGSIKFRLTKSPNSIKNCHCSNCVKFHGHYAPYAGIDSKHLVFIKDSTLKWYKSIQDETPNVYRGFCGECGSSLFWNPKDEDMIYIIAGCLDETTNLQTSAHIWCSQKPDYYDITDNLPQFNTEAK